jgi:hypothetical protein
MAIREVEKIKLYFAWNLSIFHVTDSPDDTLQMLLQSVQEMLPEAETDFIRQKLDTRPAGQEHTALLDITNNLTAIMAFTTLLTIPIFQDVQIVNYNNLYKWRKIG